MASILKILLFLNFLIVSLAAPHSKSQQEALPLLTKEPVDAEKVASEKSVIQDSSKSATRGSNVAKEKTPSETTHVRVTKRAAPQPPIPPAKIFDALPEEILEQRVLDMLGICMKIESKLGIGGFGLVYQVFLDTIEPRYVSSILKINGNHSNTENQHDSTEMQQDANDDQKPAGILYTEFSKGTEAAVKFFKKPKCIDYERELHFHSRFVVYAEKTKDLAIWQYFPKIIYSSNTRLPFLPEELDFDKISSFSDSDQADQWHPDIMPPLRFYATIIYEYLPFTLHDFRGLIQDSPHLAVYERVIVYKIVQALRYLAHLDIIHKDIKDKNIMLNLRNGLTPTTEFSSHQDAYEQLLANLDVKLIDFGLSLDRSSDRFGQGGGKTREYESPENIIKLPKTSKSFDMWSLGILLLEWYLEESFFVRKYSHMNLYFIHLYIETIDPLDWPSWTTGRFWDRHAANLKKSFEQFSKEDQGILEKLHEKWLLAFERMQDSWTRHFVLSMLRVRPSHRVTAAQALQHPYFNPINSLNLPPYSQALADHLEYQFGDFSFSESDEEDDQNGEQSDLTEKETDLTDKETEAIADEQNHSGAPKEIPPEPSIPNKSRGSKSEL